MPPLSHSLFRSALLVASACLLPSSAAAQLTLNSAVDLAMQNSPRVQVAAADVARTEAVVQQTRDVYIPSVTLGGSGYGKSYGFPLGQPTAFNVQAQSLVFSYSQRDYIRSARESLRAASLSLSDTRESVAEDTLIAYLTLAHDTERQTALQQQEADATRLVTIVEDRLNAGQDTSTDLTSTRLTEAQINLRLLQIQDDLAVDRVRLGHLLGRPPESITLSPTPIPVIPPPPPASLLPSASTSPGIDALYANAQAKREQAFGDKRYLFRPQLSFAAQYSALSTFSNSEYLQYFGRRNFQGMLLPFPAYAVGIGVQLSVPVLDYVHRARARETAADAAHAEHDADEQRNLFLENRLRTARTREELIARAKIATLDQQLAAQQLDVLRIQLQTPGGGPTPMTPKDEQNARISERDKYLALLDAQLELQRTSITLLREANHLESWLESLSQSPSSGAPAVTSAAPPATTRLDLTQHLPAETQSRPQP